MIRTLRPFALTALVTLAAAGIAADAHADDRARFAGRFELTASEGDAADLPTGEATITLAGDDALEARLPGVDEPVRGHLVGDGRAVFFFPDAATASSAGGGLGGGGLGLAGALATMDEPRRMALIDASQLNLRAGSSTDTEVIGQAASGQRFEIIGEDGDWLKIRRDDGSEAFIHGDFARRVEMRAITAAGRRSLVLNASVTEATVFDGETEAGTLSIETRLPERFEVHINLRIPQHVRVYRDGLPVMDFLTSAGEDTYAYKRAEPWKIVEQRDPPESKIGKWGLQYFARYYKGMGFHSEFCYPRANGRRMQRLTIDGTPRSHGCCRLFHDDAIIVHTHLPEGTKVFIYEGEWEKPSWER